MMKKLQEKYKQHDVVFFGIHSAGTKMKQVQALLKLKDWSLTTAVDEGSDIVDGLTVQRYGVRGWPTTIVVDGQGNIVFNSNDIDGDIIKSFVAKKRLADALGMPWPIEKGATEDEVRARYLRLEVYMYSQQIDAALAKS